MEKMAMSKEIFDKNIEAMKKWYAPFAEAIEEGRYEKDELEILDERSWDDELIFRVRREEKLLYLNGKRNAKKPVDIWMEKLGEIPKYAPVFLLGLGNGAYLKRLVAETDETVVVVAYEPSVTIFLKMLEEVDLSEEIEKRPIAFVIDGINGNEFEPLVSRLITIATIQYLKVELHPNYSELFVETMLEKTKLISDKTDSVIVNANTGMLFSAHIAKNQLENMRYVCDGYNTKRLSEVLPTHVPAILVSAGPSLNDSIEALKKAKNKAFILAVDTALKPLLNAGIVPDAYVTIDAKKPLSLVEHEIAKKIPLITQATANSEILKEQEGKIIFYYDGYALPQLAYTVVGKVLYATATGGSVACNGFSVLYKMGFDTIILVGQDLAYTNNKSHADGTFQSKMPEEDTSRMIRVKGNYEEEVPTLSNLKMYLEWFEMYIKGIKEHRKTVRVINATAGGAYIEGTELMSLEQAISENCKEEIDFTESFEKLESEFSEEERKRVVAFLHTIPAKLGEIVSVAKKLQNAYKKLHAMSKTGKIERDGYLKLLKKIEKLTKACEKNITYQLIISTMSLAESIVRMDSLNVCDTIEEEARIISEQGMKFASLLKECAQLLQGLAEETLLTIE